MPHPEAPREARPRRMHDTFSALRHSSPASETSAYYGDSLDLDEHLRAGEAGDGDQRAGWEIVGENFLPQLGEPVAVASVGDEDRHRHHIGEPAASLPERLAQARKYLTDLAVE